MLILHQNRVKSAEIETDILTDIGGETRFFERFILIEQNTKNIQIDLDKIRSKYKIDINHIPNFDFANTQLLMSDMDSTLINIECIDEMAKVFGVGDQVSKITKQAMRGELDFNQSLLTRLKLLKGLPSVKLTQIYQTTLKVNPGVHDLFSWLNKQKIPNILVSGGFDFFAKKVAESLAMTKFLANQLIIADGKLTGEIKGKIVNGQAKAYCLLDYCVQHNLELSKTIAIGDGSNDLAMMQQAGLSVAYHAKPIVQNSADIVINYGGLDTLLDFFEAQKI